MPERSLADEIWDISNDLATMNLRRSRPRQDEFMEVVGKLRDLAPRVRDLEKALVEIAEHGHLSGETLSGIARGALQAEEPDDD